MQPRRSVLYMPGANVRAMEKARNLDCDSIIFDLEDAVAPDAKREARQRVSDALSADYGHRELVVRCNGLDTPWGKEDVAVFAGRKVDGLLFPKIETQAQVEAITQAMDAAGGNELPIWLMIETPLGVLDLARFAGHPRVSVLVMGTSDLVKELRAEHTPARENIAYALQHSLLVARQLGKDILDGVHLEFRDNESLKQVCRSGRAMGFDGKTLIHPSQIDVTNEIFGYTPEQIEHAQRVLEVWQQALADGKGVAVLEGKLVENLHAAEAERVVAMAHALADRAT